MKQESEEKSEEIEDRGYWTGRLDFLLSALGYAVGLGNVWRFPYLCFKHGGGSFLVPYLIMLVFVGIPVMFLEFSIGQYSALASLPLYKKICPLFSGIGYSILLSSILGSSLYMVVLSWTIFYFFDSFRSAVPWQFCNYAFNSPNCFSDSEFRECSEEGGTYRNHTCLSTNDSMTQYFNNTQEQVRVSSAEEYFNKFVVARSSGIEDFGDFNWRIFLCILGGYVIVFFSCFKGVKSSGKVVYFTATFPYVVIFILLIRGATLDGAYEGILYYITPKWEKLNSITIWQEAAVQIFFSLSVGGGGMITLASYNKFHNNIVRDTFIISIGNCLTSILAGFAIFSGIGFIAKALNKNVEDVVAGGPGLAFIVYPEAISRMAVSPLWAVLFFLMLITLGLDSMFAGLENIVSSIIDVMPRFRSKKHWVLLAICLIGCVIGLPLSLGSGIFFLDLAFAVLGWKQLLNGVLEFVIIGYLYGMPRFFTDIKNMTGVDPGFKMKNHISVVFLTISPMILVVLLLMIFVKYEPFKSADYEYPLWANIFGTVISFAPVLIIVFLAFKKIYDLKSVPLLKRLKILTSPTEDWDDHYIQESGKAQSPVNYYNPAFKETTN